MLTLARLQLKLGAFLATGTPENEHAEGILKTIQDFFFDGWIKTLILTGLGLFLVIKGVMLGVGIVQAADDQQQRKEKINALKYMIIGVVLVIVLYLSAGAIIELIASSTESK